MRLLRRNDGQSLSAHREFRSEPHPPAQPEFYNAIDSFGVWPRGLSRDRGAHRADCPALDPCRARWGGPGGS